MKQSLCYTSALGLVVAFMGVLLGALSRQPMTPAVSWSLYALGVGLGTLPVLAVGWRVGLSSRLLVLCLGLIGAYLGASLMIVDGPEGTLPYWRWVLYAGLSGTALVVVFYLGLTLLSLVSELPGPLSGPMTLLFAGFPVAACLLVGGLGLLPLPPWTARLYVVGAVALIVAALWTVGLGLGVSFAHTPDTPPSGHWILLFGLTPSAVAYLLLLVLLAGTYVAEQGL